MESRIREGRNKLIDAFVQLVRHENNDPVVWCYPPDGLDEELRRSVPKFAFPFREDFPSSNIDYFTFVLTALDGKFRFGFCRMSAGSESTLCLISSYPWFEIFYKILNQISDAQNSSSERLRSLLEELSEVDPSTPGKKSLTIKVPGNQLDVTLEYPNPNKLPSIPESRNLTEYYNAIDGYNMLNIFASMLFERRIIVTSHKLSRLTSCVYGATSLIYPLNWQHIFIPVLPAHLLDYLSAPMPYLIGVHSSLLESVRAVEIDDAVIVDADKSHVHSIHNDLASLPSSVVSSLKKSLNLHRKADKHCCLTGDKLSTAFLNAMVALIGGYRTALVEHEGQLTFDQETFEHCRGSSMQPFLQKILQSQSFERFVEERVTFARFRKGFSDIFEEAVDAVMGKHRGSIKQKVNNLKAEKMLVNIKKKVRKTSAKTISSVKKKLDFKKNHDDSFEEGRAVQYQEDVGQAAALGPTRLIMQPLESTSDDQINLVVSPIGSGGDTPSILRRQRSSPRPSTINRRHSFIMSKADGDIGLRTGLARTSGVRNASFDDLKKDAEEEEEDGVTLSSSSMESIHGVENPEPHALFPDNQHQDITTLPSFPTETIPSEPYTVASTEPHPGHTTHPTESSSAEDTEDEGHGEYDVVGEISTRAKVNRLMKDPVVEFPSVRQLVRALQPPNKVNRRAIISVQELPNVQQIIQRYEASSKPSETLQQTHAALRNAPHRLQEIALTAPFRTQEVVLTAPFRAQEVAIRSQETAQATPHESYRPQEKEFLAKDAVAILRPAAENSLLDRKNRTSLSRKQAIRVTGTRTKKGSASSDVVDGGDSDLARPNENRYHGLLDMVKTERSSVFLEVNGPYEDDFGCLLRVSTKSASMRQLDLLEQRNSASLKRSLPVSVTARDNVQRTRTAVYDPKIPDEAETKPVVRNDLKKSSFRNALYVPSREKSATEKPDDSDSDDVASEVAVAVRAEHRNEFARSLDYEIVSTKSSPSPEMSSRSPEFGRRTFKQSWSFDGVIVDKGDIPDMPPLPDERILPGGPSGDPEREIPGSSDEGSSSDGSGVFDEVDTKWFCAAKQDGCNVVSLESDA